MKIRQNRSALRRWRPVILAIVIVSAFWGVHREDSFVRGQTPGSLRPGSMIFTPAHSSLAQAAKHFFYIRSEPVQPIPYTHKVHVQGAGMKCQECHEGVAQGPVAHFPSVRACMTCHDEVAVDSPAIKKLTEYYNKNQEPPWQRVYGWPEESHVRFNHAPHIRAEVQCATCHGDVAQMTVARRVVDHTMGFCVNCHTEKKASNDCLTCHY